MLIVLELPVKNIAAVCGVDLFDSQFFGVLNSIAVSCSSTGDGANAANLDGGAGVGAGSSGLAGSDGAGSLGRDSGRSFRGSSFGSSGGTAGGQADSHGSSQHCTDDLFVHCYSLLMIYSLRRANACRNGLHSP